MKPHEAYEAVEDIISEIPAESQSEFFKLLQYAHPLHLGGVAAESALIIPTWEETLAELPVERRQEFIADREALAKQHKRLESDFSLIITSRNIAGEVKNFATVVLSTTEGIDLGDPDKTVDSRRSWISIDPTKPNEWFMVVVNGQEVDTRRGLTLEVMQELTARDYKIDEMVLETGRPMRTSDYDAPAIRARRGKATPTIIYRDSGDYRITFRPTVEREI